MEMGTIERFKNEIESVDDRRMIIKTSIQFTEPLKTVEITFNRDAFPGMTDKQFEQFVKHLQEEINSGKFDDYGIE